MSTASMFYKLEGSEYRIRKSLRDLREAQTKVQDGRTTLYVQIPPNELGWLEKVAKDIGLKLLEIPQLPVYKTAPCGVNTTNVSMHKARCRKCRALIGKPIAASTMTLGKIEPGQELNLDSVIASLGATKDKLYAELEKVEGLLTNLTGYRDAKTKLNDLEKEVEEKMAAARMILH